MQGQQQVKILLCRADWYLGVKMTNQVITTGTGPWALYIPTLETRAARTPETKCCSTTTAGKVGLFRAKAEAGAGASILWTSPHTLA